MGKIVISENVSLDGVIEDPTGVEGLRVGGWFFEIDRGEDGERFTLGKTLGTAALLLGRRSYEFFAATWPSRGGELADKMNSLPKYVVLDPRGSRLEQLDGTDGRRGRRGLEAEAGAGRGNRRPGQAQLARTLIEHDLVDELRLMIYPVVLGGARLFGETSDKKPMRLVDTQAVGDGIAIPTYEPVRDAERALDGASLQDKRAAACAGASRERLENSKRLERRTVLMSVAPRLPETSWPARSGFARQERASQIERLSARSGRAAGVRQPRESTCVAAASAERQ